MYRSGRAGDEGSYGIDVVEGECGGAQGVEEVG